MPTRRIFSRIHAIAGVLAFVTILTFLSSSLVAEIWGNADAIAGVKQAIAWALLILVPALIATGASGFTMAGPSPKGVLADQIEEDAADRRKRHSGAGSRVLFLAWKAAQGEFDTAFIAVQIVEFAAGSANLVLMGLNIRDGLRLTRRLRRPARAQHLSALLQPVRHERAVLVNVDRIQAGRGQDSRICAACRPARSGSGRRLPRPWRRPA